MLAIVQIMKWAEFIKDGVTARRWVIIVSLLLAGFWFAINFETSMDYKSVMETVFIAFVGGLAAILEYKLIEEGAGFIKKLGGGGNG